ncbi:hypothetical protein E4U19_007928 [Claviceps sp. Clav32 group G5]|nr:hypothetical protein E4U19_007928 [Claviceps sp. Clav32 group G5]
MVADLSDDNRRVKQSKSSRGEPSRGKPAEESRTSVVMHKHIREVDGIPKVRLDSRLENRMERYATSSGDMARIHQDSFRFALDARGERREAGDEQRSLGLRLLSPVCTRSSQLLPAATSCFLCRLPSLNPAQELAKYVLRELYLLHCTKDLESSYATGRSTTATTHPDCAV